MDSEENAKHSSPDSAATGKEVQQKIGSDRRESLNAKWRHLVLGSFLITRAKNNVKKKSKPEKLWELQNYNSSSKERILRSPHIPSSRPQKIRLVNYEQRQLAQRQQTADTNPKNLTYLEVVRQKMRGVPTQAVQQVIPILPPAAKADQSRIPELDTYHKARQLFEARTDESPLSELEIKADYQLQKSMQRTTMRTKIYPTEPIDNETNNSDFETTTPLPSVTSTFTPLSTIGQPAVMPQFPSAFQPFPPPFQNLSQQAFVNPLEISSFSQVSPQIQNFPPAVSNSQNFTTTKPQFEQLGCGFDLLTNSCKDVFNIGWCNSCEDFGNIFLHDCRCTQTSQRYQQFNSTLPPEIPNLSIQSPPIGLPQQQQQQQQFISQSQLPLQSQHQTQLQIPEANIHNQSQALQNFFVQPRFFGFL